MDRPELIESVCKYEWDMFSAVNNNGGKASCQNDEAFFKKMRVCQFAGWSDDMLASYLVDLVEAAAIERNLPMEKYAWMMERTHPAEFEQIRPSLPELSAEQLQLIGQLVRPVTLTIRLMGNMFGDHAVVAVLATLVAACVPAVMMCLGALVVVIQTAVFCILTVVYISMAVSEH